MLKPKTELFEKQIEVEIKVCSTSSEKLIDNFKELVEQYAKKMSIKIVWVQKNAKVRVFLSTIGSRFDEESIEYNLKNHGCETEKENSPDFKQYLFGVTTDPMIWKDKVQKVPVIILKHLGEHNGFKIVEPTHTNIKMFLGQITSIV